MFFLLSLLPATLWLIVGYFVLFASAKTHGGVRLFGQILAAWVFVIAALFAIAGAYASIAGFPGIDMMEQMHPETAPRPGPPR